MKKIMRYLAWGFLGVAILFFILALLLPFFFPLNKIKSFAEEKLSESINRPVKIEKVSFNLFSGIKLKNISIGNAKGFSATPFVQAESIDLKYSLWPLLARQLVINQISLVKPEVFLEKNSKGEMNTPKIQSAPAKKTASKKQKALPFSLLISDFKIINGKLTYIDQGQKTELNHISLNLSGITFSILKPMELKLSANALYQEKVIPLILKSKVGFGLDEEKITLTDTILSAAGETLAFSGVIKNYSRAPNISFGLKSEKISIDTLLGIFGGASAIKTEKKENNITQSVNQFLKSIPANLIVSGRADLKNISLKDLKIDHALIALDLKNKLLGISLKEVSAYNGNLTAQAQLNLNQSGLGYTLQKIKLENFDAHPAVSALITSYLPNLLELKDKIYGQLNLNADLSGAGVEIPVILKNLKAKGDFSLVSGELKKLKIMESLAAQLKTPNLNQDIKVKKFAGDFSFAQNILTLSNLHLMDTDVRAKFDGRVDLAKQEYKKGCLLTIKLSPFISRDLGKAYDLLKDEEGYAEMEVIISGPLKAPIPTPKLDKPLKKALEIVKGKIDVRLRQIKGDTQQQIDQKKEEAKQAAEKKAQEEAEKLKQEAKEKAKGLFKF